GHKEIVAPDALRLRIGLRPEKDGEAVPIGESRSDPGKDYQAPAVAPVQIGRKRKVGSDHEVFIDCHVGISSRWPGLRPRNTCQPVSLWVGRAKRAASRSPRPAPGGWAITSHLHPVIAAGGSFQPSFAFPASPAAPRKCAAV